MSSCLNQQARRSKRQIDSLVGKVNELLLNSIYKDESFTKDQIEHALQNATGKNDRERIDNAVDTLILNKGIELSAAECNDTSPPSVNTTVNTTATVDYENTKHTNSKSCRHMHQKIDSSVVSEQTNEGGSIISSNNDINKPSSQIHNHSFQSTSSKTLSTNNTKFDTSSIVNNFRNYETQLEYFGNKNDTSTSKDDSKLSSSGLWSGSGAAKHNSAAVGSSSKIESRKQKGARASPPRMGTRSSNHSTVGVEDENNINGTASPGKKSAVVPPPSKVFSPHKPTTQTRTSIPKSSLNFDSIESFDTATLKDNDTCEDSDDEFDDFSFQGYEEVDLHQCQAKNIKPTSSFHRDIIEKCPKVKSELAWLKMGKTALAGFGVEDYHQRCIDDAVNKSDDVDKGQFIIASNEGTNTHGNPKKGNTQCTICFTELCCYKGSGYCVQNLTNHASGKNCKAAKRLRKTNNIRKGDPNEKMRLRLAKAGESYPEIKGMFRHIDGNTEKVMCLRCGDKMSLREGKALDPSGLPKHLLREKCQGEAR